MPSSPAENREVPHDIDPRISEAAKASPEKSVEALKTMLETKNYRMNAYASPDDARSREQFDTEREIINRRLNLIASMAA